MNRNSAHVAPSYHGRYDKDGSGTLSFREFSTAFLARHQTERGCTIPAEEYTNPPRSPEGVDDSLLRRPKKKHDPELMGAPVRDPGRGYLNAAVKIHGTSKGKPAHSGPAFKP